MKISSSQSFTREDTKVLKGLAIIFMIVHHLFAYAERMGEGISYISLFSIAGMPVEYGLAQFSSVCLPMFTLLGGYGTWCSCRRGGKLYPILLKKVKALYICYWQVYLIFIPACLLLGKGGIRWDISELLWMFTGWKYPYLSGWWFFIPYVILTLGYPLLHRVSGWFSSLWLEMLPVLAVRFLLAPMLAGVSGPFERVHQVALLLPSFWMGVLLAKYGILSAVKVRTQGKTWLCLGGWAGAAAIVGIRMVIGETFDFLTVSLLIVALIAALNAPWADIFRKLLLPLGQESTYCWLTHCIFCYHLCQPLVFAPRYSPLIVLWLAVLCYAASRGIRLLYGSLDKLRRYIGC